MKKLFLSLFVTLFIFNNSVYAETITGTFGGDYWKISPARYEQSNFKDPTGENIKDPFSGKMVIGEYVVNSAILHIDEFAGNLKQLYKESKDRIQSNPENIGWYELTEYIKSEKDIDLIVKNIKDLLIIDDNYLRFLDAGINANKNKFQKEMGNGEYSSVSIFTVLQGGEVLGKYNFNDGSVYWIQKLYGGDAPGYHVNKLKIVGDKILFQQTELIPYATLYNGDNLDSKNFDNNIKKAINKGFIFSTQSFKKRFSSIKTHFKIHEIKLTKKNANKVLSKNYKIENNIVKYLSTGLGDNKYIITDIDPNTVKIYEEGNSGIDKYGPFVYGLRLKGDSSKKYYNLFPRNSNSYWGIVGANKVYSYSYNDYILTTINNASLKTINYIGYTNFTDKNSKCISTKNYEYGYDAYDEKYCYGKPDNASSSIVVGKRK